MIDVEDKKIDTVTIPAEINGYPVKCSRNIFGDCSNLKEINVDEDNSFLESIDGVLFIEDTMCILSYPPAKEDRDYIVPENMNTGAFLDIPFQNCENLYSVTMPEGTKYTHRMFLNCPNLTYVHNLTICEVGVFFAMWCPKLKEVSFEGAQTSLHFVEGQLCPEFIIFQDDASFSENFGLHENPSIKEIYVPIYDKADILNRERDRNQLDYTPIPSFESYVMTEYAQKVSITDNEALEVVHLRYDSMHCGVKIDNCPNLREIIIEDADEVLEKAMRDYSEESIEYDSYLDLSNLPALESVTCYRPETNMYVRAEDCGDFTMYGSKDNAKLQEVCETKDIPY